ncbi:HNH endonuclease signature motif containing protein [soil metagenome]
MFESFDAGGLLVEVECSRLDEAAAWAHRIAAIAPLLAQRTIEAYDQALAVPDGDPGFALICGFVRTAAEVGPVLGVPPAVATKIVGYAEALDERMPLIFGLLASGRLDWESTKVILNRTSLVSREAITDLDRTLASKIAGWDCWSRTRLLNAVDAAILTVDPEAAKERRVVADTERRATVTSLPNGMAEVRAYVSAPVGARVEARLDHMAAMVCPADPRTVMQRRADAVDAISHGSFILACACDNADCTAAADAAAAETAAGTATAGAGMRCVVNVIAPAATLTGDSNDPGFLQGYGVIDADQVRDLATQPNTLLRDVTYPDSTYPDSTNPDATHGRLPAKWLHRPSAALDRRVRCRALTCSFPYCNRPAWTADLDHSIPFDHTNPHRGGPTTDTNLDPKCRLHHRIKTFLTGPDGWTTVQCPDGTIEWTSPTGRTYRCTPDGADLFDDIAKACTPAKPRRVPRQGKDRHKEKARRTAQARAGMAAKRTTNAETRRINRARAREIDQRKWRNSVRFKLFWFKGTPSTSPFATWVNHPDEDEHISATWRPPPAPQSSTDDTPPF